MGVGVVIAVIIIIIVILILLFFLGGGGSGNGNGAFAGQLGQGGRNVGRGNRHDKHKPANMTIVNTVDDCSSPSTKIKTVESSSSSSSSSS